MVDRPAERKAGRLVLLHGWLGDVADFDGLRETLPDLVSVPLPGHGGQNLAAATTTDDVLGDLAMRIEAAAAGQDYVLGGYSMGARTAAWLTATQRVDPAALVLIAGAPGITTPAERLQRLAIDIERAAEVRTRDFTEFLEHWYRLPLFADLHRREDFATILERRRARDPEQCARALELLSVGRQPDLTRHDFAREVLYIAGALDRKYSALADGWKNSRAELIPDAGHAVHLERPAAVAGRIRALESLR
jgi:2-succinyl-6-hydroxy-2,4-cyclohexadiene-1-carboxylate synthase